MPISSSLQLDPTADGMNMLSNDAIAATIPMFGARAYNSALNVQIRADDIHWEALDNGWRGERLLHLDIPIAATIHIRDVFQIKANDQIAWHRTWWHEEPATVAGLELFAGIEPNGTLESHLLPALLYDGNANPGVQRIVGANILKLIPQLAYGTPNLFEEHKFPTPLVTVEFSHERLGRCSLSLQVRPSSVVDGHIPDQWWSLGLQVDEATRRAGLQSVSGRLALNGRDESIYDGQNQVSPYRNAWVDARPRQVYQKHYMLHWQVDVPPRRAWALPLRRIADVSLQLDADQQQWVTSDALSEAARLKVAYALGRWQEDERAAGIDWWPHRAEFEHVTFNRHAIEFGWVGMNLRLGLSLWRWGQRIANTDMMARGMRIADLWLSAALQAVRSGHPAPTLYLSDQQRWTDVVGSDRGYARPTAETLFELALFCRYLREAQTPHTEWETGLAELLTWYAAPDRREKTGLFPIAWEQDGTPVSGVPVTSGVMFAGAFAEASRLGLSDGSEWLDRARVVMRAYTAQFVDGLIMHPQGYALDSGTIDGESGLFILMALNTVAAAEAHHQQDPAPWLEPSVQIAEWCLTWVYTWGVPLLPNTLLQAEGFRTRGWVDVSVQNRHLHVLSPAAEFRQLAARLDMINDPRGAAFHEYSLQMLAPLIQTIARAEQMWGMVEYGEQTEQYDHTNYGQQPNDPVSHNRGGIARWFVPWMTVWVLHLCLEFLDAES